MLLKIPKFWLHFGVWLFITFTSILSGLAQELETSQSLFLIAKVLLVNSGYAIVFYFSYFIVVNQSTRIKVFLLFLSIGLTPLINFGHYNILSKVFDLSEELNMTMALYLYYITAGFIYSFGGLFLKRAEITSQAEKRALIAEKQWEITESKYLRSQINQHFLFNALNSIYVLSYKNDKELPNLILRLSNILRYVVDQSKEKLVPLGRELSLIENYLEIQKVRLPKGFDMTYSENISQKSIPIIPLLLITLVENCFKHGDLSVKGKIMINISYNAPHLYFETFNKIEENGVNSDGSGLSLIKKRLMSEYGKNASLITTLSSDGFTAKLKIDQC